MRKPQTFYGTEKQFAILEELKRGNPDGSFLSLDELHERLPYKCTKQALQYSIRYLVDHGLVVRHERETRGGRSRRIVGLTADGYALIRAKTAPHDLTEALLNPEDES